MRTGALLFSKVAVMAEDLKAGGPAIPLEGRVEAIATTLGISSPGQAVGGSIPIDVVNNKEDLLLLTTTGTTAITIGCQCAPTYFIPTPFGCNIITCSARGTRRPTRNWFTPTVATQALSPMDPVLVSSWHRIIIPHNPICVKAPDWFKDVLVYR